MRLLVVEDERGIANFLKEGLEEEGYAVDVAANGTLGLEMASENAYDLLLLDWMLPGLSGIEVCRRIRKTDQEIPIIFLTAKDTTDDAVFGLETGANDYIKKPFDFSELLARIRVQLRPTKGSATVLQAGEVSMDPDTHRVFRGKAEIVLTAKEFSLLKFLLQNKGKVCSRTRIIEHVWDIHFDSDTSIIDVYINYLRKKLDDGSGKHLIQTVRGVGYLLQDSE
jgi:two-component system copper resistance phosphate regulon response regulator CusR